MPAKQKVSPKVKNAGKKRRVVADPKVVNRTGGRKPQPRWITSTSRVQAICKQVQAHASEYLKLRNIEETTDFQYRIDFWSGVDNFEPSDEMSGDKLQLAQEAFVYGCNLVPDSAFAKVDDQLAVRGRNCDFFEPLMAKKEQERTEANQQRKRPSNRNANKQLSGFAQALVSAGHAEATRQSVAQRVAAATIKSS